MEYTVEQFISLYGEGKNCPTKAQWQTLLDGNMTQPLTVLNFFKLRDVADSSLIDESMSGQQAFMKYAETSVPKVSQVGGEFLLRGTVEGDFIGDKLEDWHIVAIGSYPQRENFLKLILDEDYKNALKYRQAAVEKQNVFFIHPA